MAHILPCIYCRETFTQYVKNDNHLENMKQRNMIEWSYHAKEMVNMKLFRQSNQPKDCLYQPCLTLQQLKQRLMIPFCEKNVWEIMLLFSLNYDPTTDMKNYEIVYSPFASGLNYTSRAALFESVISTSPYHRDMDWKEGLKEYRFTLSDQLQNIL